MGLALLPGVRAGWQCVTCRVCQVCRQPEDVSKVRKVILSTMAFSFLFVNKVKLSLNLFAAVGDVVRTL